MKTIKQIADELGISKETVKKRIAREPLCTNIEPFITLKDGIKYITENGENLIKSAFKKNVHTSNPNVPSIRKPLPILCINKIFFKKFKKTP
jgi:hypothetical protein